MDNRKWTNLKLCNSELVYRNLGEHLDPVFLWNHWTGSGRIGYLITDKQQILEILASDRFSAAGNGLMTLEEFLSRNLEIFKSKSRFTKSNNTSCYILSYFEYM